MKSDPLIRTRKYLESKNRWSDEQEARLRQRAKTIVHEVIEAALGIEKPPATDIFDYTFAELPRDLIQQKETQRTDSLGLEPDPLGLKSSEGLKPAEEMKSTT
jgi:TPP-dependent pyruvate/acetoin dehydrogenase alpha subunit